MPRLTLLLILSLMLAGCATKQIAAVDGRVVPDDRIYNADYLSRNDGDETVVFVRDKGSTGSACTLLLFIDNDKAFGLRHGDAVTTHLQPGHHYFRIESQYCAGGVASTTTELVNGEPQTFRISLSMTGIGFARVN